MFEVDILTPFVWSVVMEAADETGIAVDATKTAASVGVDNIINAFDIRFNQDGLGGNGLNLHGFNTSIVLGIIRWLIEGIMGRYGDKGSRFRPG